MAKFFLLASGLSGCLAVILGAFGAHGLKHSLTATLLSAFETGVQYQFIHTLSLLALGVLLSRMPHTPAALTYAGLLWLAGMVLFSGSLYALALGGPKWLGPITPLGGLMLILGWLSLTLGIWKASP